MSGVKTRKKAPILGHFKEYVKLSMSDTSSDFIMFTFVLVYRQRVPVLLRWQRAVDGI